MTTTADTYDLVIIGAGIAGAALAWNLLHAGPADQRRPRVLVLEREPQPGYHSTGRSAAMFMETYGAPQARALTRASRAFYATPPDGFADVPLLAPRGAVYLGWEGDAAALDALHQELSDTGSAVGRASAQAMCRQVPVLRPEGLLGGVTEPDAMDIDVQALHQGYLRGMRRAGGSLRCDADVRQLSRDGAQWHIALADGTELRAERVVNAAGAWADMVAGLAGLAPLGLQPRRRSAFTFAAPPSLDTRSWPSVAAVDNSWYFKPDAGQLLGSPANADPVPPHDVVPEELDIAIGIDGIQRRTTMEIRRPGRTWAGLRTFAPDDELVIGDDPRAPGFFWLAGQGGYGIQSGQGAALLATRLLLARSPTEDALAEHGVVAAAMAPARLLR
ncbi:MAG: NAD(P)/FAD-dependent oxidoreductase [Aquabacterium sp.]